MCAYLPQNMLRVNLSTNSSLEFKALDTTIQDQKVLSYKSSEMKGVGKNVTRSAP